MSTPATGGQHVELMSANSTEPPRLDQKPDRKGKGPEQAQQTAVAAASTGEPAKKLPAAELKAKKQAEKAARRAQAIAVKTANAAAAGDASEGQATTPKPHAAAEGGKGAKGRNRQDGYASAPSGRAVHGGHGGKPPTGGPKPFTMTGDKEKRDPLKSTTSCFAHLPEPKRIELHQADRDVHPAILALGQQMATFAVRENTARLRATLEAFKEVIRSYEAPPGNAFSRYFVPQVLNPQIEYLTECRPMCYAMGNAIRLLKTRVTDLDIETSDKEAIGILCDVIDTFIQEKINLTEVVITNNAAAMIAEGDSVLTYGHHRLVRKAIRQAWAEGRRFKVVIVEDQGAQGGRDLAKLLRRDGVAVTYFPELAEVRSLLGKSAKVMLGVEAVFANGALYAPAGTSDIAAAASALEVPVIALSESINVDRDRVAVDSLTYNEIDPEKSTELGSRLLFDATQARHVSVLVTEYETVTGNAPAAAVLAILRKQDEPV